MHLRDSEGVSLGVNRRVELRATTFRGLGNERDRRRTNTTTTTADNASSGCRLISLNFREFLFAGGFWHRNSVRITA